MGLIGHMEGTTEGNEVNEAENSGCFARILNFGRIRSDCARESWRVEEMKSWE